MARLRRACRLNVDPTKTFTRHKKTPGRAGPGVSVYTAVQIVRGSHLRDEVLGELKPVVAGLLVLFQLAGHAHLKPVHPGREDGAQRLGGRHDHRHKFVAVKRDFTEERDFERRVRSLAFNIRH